MGSQEEAEYGGLVHETEGRTGRGAHGAHAPSSGRPPTTTNRPRSRPQHVGSARQRANSNRRARWIHIAPLARRSPRRGRYVPGSAAVIPELPSSVRRDVRPRRDRARRPNPGGAPGARERAGTSRLVMDLSHGHRGRGRGPEDARAPALHGRAPHQPTGSRVCGLSRQIAATESPDGLHRSWLHPDPSVARALQHALHVVVPRPSSGQAREDHSAALKTISAGCREASGRG